MASTSTAPLTDIIAERLTAALAPTRLEVANESHMHAGHMGDDGTGETHFRVEIESPAFTGLTRVARQRLVNRALADLLATRIHALAISACAPDAAPNTGPDTGRIPRPAARILLVDAQGRTLLMRFAPEDRPPLWCTPGGAVDPGETYEAAARREVWEEAGLDIDCGPQVAQRTAEFVTFEGVEVTADERYFRVDLDAHEVAHAALTPLERRLMTGTRWFTRAEIAAHDETIYPADLIALLDATEPAHAR